MKTYCIPGLARSLYAPALLAAMILPSAPALHAATLTWDGNGAGGTALDTAANWVGDAVPTTSDEVLFDNSVITSGSYPSGLSLDTSTTWGSFIWNTSQGGVGIGTSGTASNFSLSLSGASAGSAAVVAAGGAAGDIILLGSNFTSGTVTLGGRIAGNKNLTINLPDTAGNYSINVVNAGATLVLGQVSRGLANNVTLTKNGQGTLTLANNNTSFFTGALTGRKFTLNEGTLDLTGNAGIGNAAFQINGGTFLDNSGTAATVLTTTSALSVINGDFTFKGTNTGGVTLSFAAGVTLAGAGSARQITVAANNLTINAAIGGTGYGLTKAGAGGLILGAANTYDGATTISGGTLSTSAANALPVATEVIVSNGTSTATAGTLNLSGVSQTVQKLSSSVTGAGTTKGVVMNNGANSTATLTVTGTSTFDGTLKNGTSAPATRILALAKSTGGILRLTGTASTYTGGTTVSGGTLLANNASGSATGTGAVVVNGGFFGGTGTSSGAITVNAGGSITPGDGGAGTFHGGSSLTWNSDNTLAGMTFDLGVNQAASDQLALTGAFTKGTGSTFVFNFVDAGYTPSVAYTLVTFGSTTFSAGDFAATGIAGSFAVVGNSLQFTAAAIPEPSTYAALAGALALGGVLVARRRRA